MFQQNPEEFISKTIRLIKEQKASMIVDGVTYNQADGSYDSDILPLRRFLTESHSDFSHLSF